MKNARHERFFNVLFILIRKSCAMLVMDHELIISGLQNFIPTAIFMQEGFGCIIRSH